MQSTSLLATAAVAEDIASQTLEDATSETFTLQHIFDLVGQGVFATLCHFSAFLVETRGKLDGLAGSSTVYRVCSMRCGS